MKCGFELSSDKISVCYFCGADRAVGQCGDHCHDRYEITLLLSASGSYLVEGSEHKVKGGNLIFITPSSYHKVDLSEDCDIEGYSIHFSKNALSGATDAALRAIEISDDSSGKFYPPSRLSDAMLSAFDRFLVAEELAGDTRSAFMEALLTEIIILLSASDGENIRSSEEELGARVARYLNSNLEKSLSLDKLARRFFVSKYYLCRAFKSYSGTSPHAYVNQKKIVHAKRLIESGMTASAAAERVGFGDYSAFYRAYVKAIGRSPAAEQNK